MNTAMDISALLALRRHLSIVHHLPGRIRLRFGPALWSPATRMERDQFERLVDGLEGIRDVRVNKALATAIIEYDPRLVPSADWETLVRGDTAEAAAVLNEWLACHGRLPHDQLEGVSNE